MGLATFDIEGTLKMDRGWGKRKSSRCEASTNNSRRMSAHVEENKSLAIALAYAIRILCRPQGK